MFVKVVKDLTHALIWYAVAMLLLFVQGDILYYHYCTCCVFGEIKLLKKKKDSEVHF